jgi:hypothetical protein
MTLNIDNIIYYTGVIYILNLAKKGIIKITPDVVKNKVKNKIYNISYELGLSGLVVAGNTINIISKLKNKFKKNVNLINLTEVKNEFYDLKFKSYNINDSTYIEILNNNLDTISDEDNVLINNKEELNESSPLIKKKSINIVNPFLSVILNHNNKEYDILENLNNFMIEGNELTNNFFIWFMDEYFKIKIKNDKFKITLVERKNFDIKTYQDNFVIKI